MNLPVKTRIPCAMWVLAGFITLFSLTQVDTKPGFDSHYASVSNLIAHLR